MTGFPATVTERHRDGCGCPAFVRNCVHVDGAHTLTLIDRLLLSPEVRFEWIRPTDKRFYVSNDTEYDYYTDALAAFHEAELALLRGAE